MENDKKLTFKEDTVPIISEILGKNQAEESDDKILEKLGQGKPLSGEIIFSAVEKIFYGTAEESVCSFLKEGLEITDQTAAIIYKDIKEKLIPIVEKEQSEISAPKRKDTTAKKISGPDKYRETV